jgi:hypothetical protein
MRIILDLQIRRPNKELEQALDEIRERHEISGPGGDHETYDIAMAALQSRHRLRFRWIRP